MVAPENQSDTLSKAVWPSCGRLLGRLRLEGSSLVELKCRGCHRVATFVAVPSSAQTRK